MSIAVHAANTAIFPTVVGLVALLIVFFYYRGWHHLTRELPNRFAIWRLAAFVGGVLLAWIVIASPLAALDHQSLTIHMLKHLLLMTVAAPVLLAAVPATPLRCEPTRICMRSGRIFAQPRLRAVQRRAAYFVICWLVGTFTVILWHIPIVFRTALHSNWIHAIEDISFLAAGLFFWAPVIQPFANRTRSLAWSVPFYLFMATLPCDILSAFLTFCGRVIYQPHVETTRVFALSPLQDQACAGALMWVWVTFAYLIPAAVVTVQILSLPDPAFMNCAERLPPILETPRIIETLDV